MTEFIYLTTSQVVQINGLFGGAVREQGTVDAHVFMLAIANKAIEHAQVVEWLVQHRHK
ncbi:hypothetical protein [Kribbella sp. NPDC051718]|uniref:hypothetical protein n=1 Tax=Kribbella sp. NPDC051718 TaxID=3155168 RepID=UPI003425BFEA